MAKEIALAGFVLTGDEWDALDDLSRAQLLRVALRRDEPWLPSARAAPGDRDDVIEAEPYLAYELVLGFA